MLLKLTCPWLVKKFHQQTKLLERSDFRLLPMLMRSVLFWDITQRQVVILYRHYGTTYWSHLFNGQEVQKQQKAGKTDSPPISGD
jgi:hypothetical protein